MPLARLLRLLTLVLSFASLQLTLLAGGPGCPMPVGDAAPAGAAGAMAGMDMAGMDMAGPTASTSGPASGAADGRPDGRQPDAPHSAPCDESATPQACPTMAPCLFAAVLPEAQPEAPVVRGPSTVVAALVLTPASVTSAPELPPPRA